MNENIEKDDRGITLGDIFRITFSQKWLALAILVIFTVASSLGMYYRSKSGEYYTSTFLLQLPSTTGSTSTSYTYPDGYSFYFTDLISSKNLKSAASRAGLENINVDSMVRSGDISISRIINKIDENAEGGVYEFNYTITVSAAYFKSESEARTFIEAITSVPGEHIGSMVIDYDKSLSSSRSAATYSEQLNLLKEQAIYIQSKYAQLTDAFGDVFPLQDGKSLASSKKEVDAYLEKDLFSALSRRADENGYVKTNEEAKLQYQSELYTQTLALNSAKETLKGINEFHKDAGSTIIYDAIISLNREIATLEQKIEILKRYIAAYDDATKIAPADYEAEIAKVEAAVKKFTDDLNPVSAYVYSEATKVDYLSSKVVELGGGRSLIKTVLICFVIGFVMAAVVAFIVGYIVTQKKAKRAKKIISVAVDEESSSGGDKKE